MTSTNPAGNVLNPAKYVAELGNYSNSQDVVAGLKHHIEKHPGLKAALTFSLRAAREKAETELDPELFRALDWPTDCNEYLNYLSSFARWIPQQSGDPVWLPASVNHPTEHQEVYDRLCHFYYLVDQDDDQGKTPQEDPWFADWLVDYADLWGSYLDSTDSFNNDILTSFADESPEYRVKDSMVDGHPNAPSGWLTFNQFFARELNPGLRPIAKPFDNTTVTSPADCTYKATYEIGPDSEIDEIVLKKSHCFANVKDLLEGSPHAEAFANGTFVHYFLGPYSYHRFHTPVAGRLLECRALLGQVYLDVGIKDAQFVAPDSSLDGYEFNQARGVVIMDTGDSPYGDIGLVGVVPVGMCQVSSVVMTAQPHNVMLKGDEFGYFLFGGSDIIMLFQESATPKIVADPTTYLHYGNQIATCETRP